MRRGIGDGGDDDGGGDDDDKEMRMHHPGGMLSPLKMSLAKYLNRALPEAEKTGRAARNFGPYTSVPLTGSTKMIGSKCGCMVFIPVLTLIVFMADIALAIVDGLDIVDRGSQSPYVQFSLSIAIAVLYMALGVMALTQYFWERVLNFKYHTVWSLCMASILAWIGFGVRASWISHFHGSADGVESAATVAYISWVAVNTLGLAGFMLRFTILAVAIALRYTYDRTVEIQARVVTSASGGSSIRELLSNRRFPPALRRRSFASQASADVSNHTVGSIRMQQQQHPMWSETNFGAHQQRQQYHHHHHQAGLRQVESGGSRRSFAALPSAFRQS